MEIFTVAFFGHRKIGNIAKAEKMLEKIILNLIEEKIYVDFLIGRNGDFDMCASAMIKQVQEKYNNCNSSHILVLPYKTAEYINNKENFDRYYDEIEICDKAWGIYPKRAIQIRNKEMIDRADLVVCYVERNEGGAFQTIEYALKQGKKIINIAT